MVYYCRHLKGTNGVPVFIDGDLDKSYIEIRCKECNQLISYVGKPHDSKIKITK